MSRGGLHRMPWWQLRARGVDRFCFFCYAHKPGVARPLNRWVAETAARYPEAIPLGTLDPEDADFSLIPYPAIRWKFNAFLPAWTDFSHAGL